MKEDNKGLVIRILYTFAFFGIIESIMLHFAPKDNPIFFHIINIFCALMGTIFFYKSKEMFTTKKVRKK